MVINSAFTTSATMYDGICLSVGEVVSDLDCIDD